MAPLSNSIVFCSAMANFGKRIEFDKLSPKSPKNIYKNDITGELRCHLLFQAPVFFEVPEFFIFGPI